MNNTLETARLLENVLTALEGQDPDALGSLGQLGDGAWAGLEQLDVHRQETELDDSSLVVVVHRQFVQRRHQLVSRETGSQRLMFLALQRIWQQLVKELKRSLVWVQSLTFIFADDECLKQ